MLSSLKPVRWLRSTSHRPDRFNPDFTVGEIRSLRWQTWWMRHMPYRTYPLIPFEKKVYLNWRGKKVSLPRPWAKNLLEWKDDEDA